jgi:hypothetical protein
MAALKRNPHFPDASIEWAYGHEKGRLLSKPPFPYALLRKLGHGAQSLVAIAIFVVIGTAITFEAIIETVAVAVAPASLGIVTVVAIAIAGLALNADFEAPDAVLDVIALPARKAVAGDPVQSVFDIAGFAAQTGGLSIAQDIPAIEMSDLPLDGVDARVKAANLAIVVVPIGVALGLRRIPLGGCRRGCNEGRSGERGGNNELTHLALSFEKRLMRYLWDLALDRLLNVFVICRSATLTVQPIENVERCPLFMFHLGLKARNRLARG